MLSCINATFRRSKLSAGLLARRCSAGGAQPQPVCTEIVLKQKEKRLEVAFGSGERFSLPAEYLRISSTGAVRAGQGVVHGRRHVGILAIEPVGSYGVRLQFDDLHSSGIYTYTYLHELGSHKLSRLREYIRALRRHGLSRDPPARRLPAPRRAQPTACSTSSAG